MPTGHNKLNLLLPADKLARMLNNCIHKREDKKFTDWLQQCHRDLDEEVLIVHCRASCVILYFTFSGFSVMKLKKVLAITKL